MLMNPRLTMILSDSLQSAAALAVRKLRKKFRSHAGTEEFISLQTRREGKLKWQKSRSKKASLWTVLFVDSRDSAHVQAFFPN